MKKLIYLLMFSFVFSQCIAKDLWTEQAILDSEYKQYDILKIKFLDSLTGFVSGPTNLLKTTDGGKTWEEKIIVEFMGNAINEFQILPDGFGFIMRARDIYQISTDFGETWTDYPVPSKHIYSKLVVLDNNRIWAMDIISKIIIFTKDGGNSWDSLKFDNYNDIQYFSNFSILNNDTFLITTTLDIILRTTDGGNNWSEVKPGLDSIFYTFFFIDDSNGWLVGAKGAIYKTTDAGNTWYKINSPVTDDILPIYFFDENEGYIATYKQNGWSYSGDIYYTNDGGSSWQLQHKCTSYLPWNLFFLNRNLGWAGSSEPNIYLKYDNTTSVDEEISEQIDKRTVFLFSDRKVHPIPASSEVTANIYWNEQYYLIENAKIKVYTSYGDEITNPEISIEKLAPYKANIKWNCSNFASGIYFIYISLGDENMAIPVIVSR